MSQTRLSTTDAAIDVRVIPRPERHRLIGTFERLNSGDTLLVINDHDPRLLSYQFDARYAGRFAWQYVEQGPDVWRVRISRTA